MPEDTSRIFILLIAIVIIISAIYCIFLKISRTIAERSAKGRPDSYSRPQNPRYVDLSECYRRQHLLTKTEYIFYGVLKKKCDSANLLICPKVRLEDFIRVTAKERMKYRGYIKSRHVDFLICDSSLHILAAIELDDPSHNSEQAKRTDYFKNRLYAAIGLPLFRIRTGQNYGVKIDKLISQITPK
ncbi:MAG: DUF2726 domain-containing protein [Lachnospiraceae bacterium]|nr:DUF2726 domain-containing protein [Lachnospiraceae bacterium]